MINFFKRIKKIFFHESLQEPPEIIKSRQIFYNKLVKKNDLVFDVGANIGNRIEPLLKIGAKVIAIEPQKKCQNILKRRFGNKIEIVDMGLGEKEEFMDFFVANVNTISSFSKEWIESVKNDRFKGYTWSKPMKIKITTLDKLIEKYGVPNFIKIDVEGFELQVLKGLHHPIDIISFEYVVPEHLYRIKDCLLQINKHNNQIECNYSIGESMEFELKRWMNVNEFLNHILSENFSSSSFGDIYTRKME